MADLDARPGAPASVPAAGNRRALPMPAHLKFFYGPMDCGKSTLALQIDHNHARQGRHGLLLTTHDRSGGATITTRVGLARPAVEVGEDTDIRLLVRQVWAAGRALDYLIVDEAGFLAEAHVDQFAELVDDWQVDVYCFPGWPPTSDRSCCPARSGCLNWPTRSIRSTSRCSAGVAGPGSSTRES